MQLTHLLVIILVCISKSNSYDVKGNWPGRKLTAFVLPARGGSDSSHEQETDDARNHHEWEGSPSLTTGSAPLEERSCYEEHGDAFGDEQYVEVEAEEEEEESLSSSTEENYKFLSTGEEAGETDEYGFVGEEEDAVNDENDFSDDDDDFIVVYPGQPHAENDAASTDALVDASGNLEEDSFHADHDEEEPENMAHEVEENDSTLANTIYREDFVQDEESDYKESIQPIEVSKTDNLTPAEHEVISTPRIEDDDSCIDRLDEADAYDDGETSHAAAYVYERTAAEKTVEEIKENTEESYILQLPKEESSSVGVQFVITRRMRKMLIYELNYTPSEVDQMRAEVAAVVIEKHLKRPPSGMPAAWAEIRDSYQSKKQPTLVPKVKKIIASVLGIVATATIMTSMGGIESSSPSLGPGDVSSEMDQEAYAENTEQQGNIMDEEATEQKEAVLEKRSSTDHFPLPRDLDETWLDKVITRMVDAVSRKN